MAVVSIGVDIDGFGGDLRKMETAIINLQKQLSFMLEHIDSSNIKSVNTEKTSISSQNGEFLIDKKQLKIGDGERVRFKAGVNGTGNFEFALFDHSGQRVGANGQFSAGTKQITVQNGLITSIM